MDMQSAASKSCEGFDLDTKREENQKNESFSDHDSACGEDADELKDKVISLNTFIQAKDATGKVPFKRANTIARSNIDFEHTDGIENETDKTIRLLLCCLCKNVLMRPMSCSACGISACANCITDWKWRDTKCPGGCTKFTYGKPSQFLVDWLSKLKVKCENAANGCQEVLNHDDVEAHQLNCTFQKKVCRNKGCKVSGTHHDLKQHEVECDFLQKHCDKCNELLSKQTEADHFCIKSLSERLTKMELIIKKLTKCDIDKADLCSRKTLMGGIFRYLNPSEYQIVVTQYQQMVTTYQFPAPNSESGNVIDAKALLLRIKVSNSGIANLVSKFSICQAGSSQAVDAYHYLINNEGVGQVVEVMLPWDPSLLDHINVRVEANPNVLNPTQILSPINQQINARDTPLVGHHQFHNPFQPQQSGHHHHTK